MFALFNSGLKALPQLLPLCLLIGSLSIAPTSFLYADAGSKGINALTDSRIGESTTTHKNPIPVGESGSYVMELNKPQMTNLVDALRVKTSHDGENSVDPVTGLTLEQEKTYLKALKNIPRNFIVYAPSSNGENSADLDLPSNALIRATLERKLKHPTDGSVHIINIKTNPENNILSYGRNGDEALKAVEQVGFLKGSFGSIEGQVLKTGMEDMDAVSNEAVNLVYVITH